MATARFAEFTDGTRKVFSAAREESLRLNHNYIGTEHVLLGLCTPKERETGAMLILGKFGVDRYTCLSAVEFTVGRGERPPSGEIGLTPRTKKVVELAADEASQHSHNLIGTSHLLIGLLREGEGVAAGILQSLGVTLDKAREQMEMLSPPQLRDETLVPSQQAESRDTEADLFDQELARANTALRTIRRNTRILQRMLLRIKAKRDQQPRGDP